MFSATLSDLYPTLVTLSSDPFYPGIACCIFLTNCLSKINTGHSGGWLGTFLAKSIQKVTKPSPEGDEGNREMKQN